MNGKGFDQIFSVAALIVYLAIVATLVGSPLTRGIVLSLGESFANAIKSAKH